jgi:RecA-family ATPase
MNLSAEAAREHCDEREEAERCGPGPRRSIGRDESPPGGEAPPPQSSEDYGAAGEPGRGGEDRVVELPLVSAANFAGREVPAREWIVADLIPNRTVTIVAGDGAVGKSTLVLQLAVAAAARREWIGRLPDPGAVVFVSAEDDQDELHRRLASIVAHLGVEFADLADLHLVPLAGLDAVMAAPSGKAAIVTPTPVWRGLVSIVGRVQPRLVILDTLADVFAGNENTRSEARQFIGLLRGLAIEHCLAVILLAHPSLAGLATGSGTSGSTAWSNSVRSRLYLETVRGDDGREIDADVRVLRVKKANYAPAGLELRIRWSKGCFVIDGPASGFDKLAADGKADRVFLDLLIAFKAQGRSVSPNRSANYAPAVFERHPEAQGVTKRAFVLAMERLLKDDRVRIETTGSPSRQRQHLVAVACEGDE